MKIILAEMEYNMEKDQRDIMNLSQNNAALRDSKAG